MKRRTSFVSNSSSSSFLIMKEHLTHRQLYLIKSHTEVGPMLGVRVYNKEWDRWSLTENEFLITGYTSMDNFSMCEFLGKIGVDMDKVSWGQWGMFGPIEGEVV